VRPTWIDYLTICPGSSVDFDRRQRRIAWINSVANIGGVFAATILGHFGLFSMAACLFAGANLAMTVDGKAKSVD